MGQQYLGFGRLCLLVLCGGLLVGSGGCATGEQQPLLDCGDGVANSGESCDGTDFAGATCVSEGFDGGALTCSRTCELVTSACTRVSCGDGLVQGNEECDDADNDDLDGCSANCTVEAAWTCMGEPSVCSSMCGNNQLDLGEECDSAQLAGETCVGLGFDGGTLACSTGCTFNTAGCTVLSCGDGTITAPEVCDGPNLGGATCASVGDFIGGTLVCGTSCGYDVSGCTPIRCGDGVISAGETCDDNDMDSGDGCNVLCAVEDGWVCSGEPSVCEVACGNGDVDAGEDCDGTNLDAKTCMSEGFAGGDLSCASCQFDTSACLESICPNGTREGSEGCDGTDFGGKDCTDFGFAGGDLSCTTGCEVVTTACVASVCGNNVVETGEQCDDNNNVPGDGCSDTCQWENTCTADDTIACGGSDSQGGASGNDVDNYTCSTLGDSADRVYALTIPAGVTSVTASVTCDDSSDDYDLYVMDACNPDTCADSGTTASCDSLTFAVTPGATYYLVVEEYDAFWGGYTLDVSCL